MPFFKQSQPAPAPVPVQEPIVEEKRGLFGRKKTVVRDPNNRNSLASPTSPTRNKLSPTSPTHGNSTLTGSSHVNRLDEINTAIPAARDKVRLAEEAENRARIALKQAEVAVIEARRHVAALETEAREQARLAELASREAQVKLNEVDSLKKKTGKMGRI